MRAIGRSAPLFLPLLVSGLVLGCDAAPTEPSANPGAVSLAAGANRVTASATGGGWYNIAGVFDVQLAFSAVQKADGGLAGEFHHRTGTGDGLFDVRGSVTGLAFDLENRRE